MPPSGDPSVRVISAGEITARWGAAIVLVLAGSALILLAGPWRGIETTLSSHTIQLVTGQTTLANPASHSLILYKGESVYSIFVLTNECSVAYLLAAVLIGSAPLMLLRQLSPWRTASAVGVTAVVLILVNIVRLTAIGATVSTVGHDPGLQIAHTYLGSLLTIVGACAAGVALVAVLVGHRRASATANG